MNATAKDRPRLRAALNTETVPWIKRALERALEKTSRSTERTPLAEATFAEPPQRLIADLRAAAINDVAGTVIHELATIIASLRLHAPEEVPNYSATRTGALLENLGGLLTGIRNLKLAASRAEYQEFNLAQECRSICDIFKQDAIFHFAGADPFLVELDPNLLKLALSNIVRNAIEALADREPTQRSITLNWGHAGQEIFLSVLDNGPGFEREPFSMIELGKTTKDGQHFGFGLGTARQAMQAMEGDLYPANSRNGGALLEMRWFSNDDDSVR